MIDCPYNRFPLLNKMMKFNLQNVFSLNGLRPFVCPDYMFSYF